MTDRNLTIGVIGLGAMGLGLALRLVDQGFAVVGFDVNPARNQLAAEGGVLVAENPGRVAQQASQVICLVDTSKQMEDVVSGRDGVASSAKPGDYFLCMSTIELDTILSCHSALETIDVELLDAPISGGPQAARDGSLNVLVGASEAAVKACRPVLETISSRVWHMGALGAGHAAKMVNNIAFHGLSVGMLEGLVLGTKAGLDPEQMYEILRNSTGDSAALRIRVPRILARDFEGGPLSTAYREMVMETDFARRHGLPVPLAAIAEEIYRIGMARGLGEEEGAALVKVYEEWASVRVSAAGAT